MSTGGKINLQDGAGSHQVSLKAQDTALAADVTWTLPSADGSAGQVLATDGAGALSWASAGGGASKNIVEITSSNLTNKDEVLLISAPDANKFVNIVSITTNITNPISVPTNLISDPIISVKYLGGNELLNFKLNENVFSIVNYDLHAYSNATAIVCKLEKDYILSNSNYSLIDNFSGGSIIRIPYNTASRAVGAVYSGGIYYASNFGLDWEKTDAPDANWSGIAVGNNMTKVVACVNGGGIYKSFFGNPWTKTAAPDADWKAIVSNGFVTVLFACIYNGKIYRSQNGGDTWSELSNSFSAAYVSMAANQLASNIIAAAPNESFYISTDAGENWAQPANLQKNWGGVSCSIDFAVLAAFTVDEGIYVSTDAGSTWSKTAAPDTGGWTSITVAYAGDLILATKSTGEIYYSRDLGYLGNYLYR